MPTPATAHPAAGLSADLRRGPQLAFARPAGHLPTPAAVPDRDEDEPRWDGFRLIEISADATRTGHTDRHPVRSLRARPERAAADPRPLRRAR